MKRILFVLSFLGAVSSAFAGDFGPQLSPIDVDGSPAFLMFHSQGSKAVLQGELIFRVTQREVGFSPAYVAFVDAVSGEFLSPWLEASQGTTGVIVGTEATLKWAILDPVVASHVSKNLKKSILVVSFGKPAPQQEVSAFVAVNELCATHSSRFVDIDSARPGCP